MFSYENICVLAPTKKLREFNSKDESIELWEFHIISDYKDNWENQILRLNNLIDKSDLDKYSNLHNLFIFNLSMHEYFKEVLLKESLKFDKKYSNLEIKDRLSSFINYMVLNYDNFF